MTPEYIKECALASLNTFCEQNQYLVPSAKDIEELVKKAPAFIDDLESAIDFLESQYMHSIIPLLLKLKRDQSVTGFAEALAECLYENELIKAAEKCEVLYKDYTKMVRCLLNRY